MSQLPIRRCLVLFAVISVLTACSAGLDRLARPEFTDSGPILDTRTGAYLSRDDVMRRAIASRFVILGEVHDNAAHHRLQTAILKAMLDAGRRPALAMEQFDLQNQPALDAARARGERHPERLADAGRFDRKGWRWPDYRPLVELAATAGLPLSAANLSREEARTLMKSGLPARSVAPATQEQRGALEQDIIEGHCGIRPPAAILSGMVEAQRARDARMAQTLESVGEGGAVLIAGGGHARRDRGVPSYLPPAAQEKLLSIGFVEVAPDGTTQGTSYAGIYDVVWFTPRATRGDPCKDLSLPQ
jgi:uncharacterized iron-regulated protein